MRIAHTIQQARAAVRDLGSIALVPTLGALHAGHIALIEAAQQYAPRVAISIFVNPTQFAPHEDFNRYPRPIEDDLAKCRSAGAALVFNPSPEEMYPPNQPLLREAVIDFPSLTGVLEGKHRPTHFRGVCQVVAKLFNILQPAAAVFGQKDYQQFRILQAMVEALNFPLEMKMIPTVRDADGLALSSRHAYLTAEQRRQALTISRALFKAEADFKSGIRQSNRLIAAMRNTLLESRLIIDYVAAIDPQTLQPVEQITAPTVLAIAARVGNTRLIDNIIIT